MNRQQKIEDRRKCMPERYRANYDQAVSGRSRAAAVKAICLECVCFQKEEVRLCTSLACPLYPYRPYKLTEESKQYPEGTSLAPESNETES